MRYHVGRVEGRLPVFQDFVEDNVRARGLVVLSAVFMFVSAALIFSWDPVFVDNAVADVSFASTPTSVLYTSYKPDRIPRIQTLNNDGHGVSGVQVTASVNALVQTTSRNTLSCDTAVLSAMTGTLEYLRVADACQVILAGATSTTDAIGLVEFPGLMVQSGPPGMYELQFSSGSQSATQTVGVASNVFDIQPLTLAPTVGDSATVSVPIGTTLAVQPQVKLVDVMNRPVVGRTVTAFVWPTPYFFKPDATQQVNRRGQQYATLKNAVSLPSDANGIAQWKDFTIEGATSNLLYIYFYIDGKVASWNNAADKPISLPIPEHPTYTKALQLSTTVTTVKIDKAPPATATEGTALSTQPRIQVTDSKGVGIAGKRVFALIHTANGFATPDLNMPQYDTAERLKTLLGAVSDMTDSQGFVTFNNLTFTQTGATDGSSAFKIVFACDGVLSDPTAAIKVASTVTAVQIQSVPVAIPNLRGEADDASEDYSAPASVRVVDANGNGVPGKVVTVQLVDATGTPIAASNGAVIVSRLVSNVPQVTGSDGFVTLRLVFAYLNPSFDASDVRLQFMADGVKSSVSAVVQLDRQLAAVQAAFVQLTEVPTTVQKVGTAFNVQVKVVDQYGAPVKAALTLQLLNGMYPNKADMFVATAAAVSSGTDGMATVAVTVDEAPAGVSDMWLRISAGNALSQLINVEIQNTIVSMTIAEIPANTNAVTVPVNTNEGTLAISVIAGAALNGQTPKLTLVNVPSQIPFVYASLTDTGTAGTIHYGTTGTDGQKFATLTFPNTGTDTSGKAQLKLKLATGVAGRVTIAVNVHGVRSAPVTFLGDTGVTKIDWVTQPAADATSKLVKNGNFLSTFPKVKLTDANGAAVEGAYVNAAWVNDDGTPAPAMADLVLDKKYNLVGYRQSDPSAVDGTATWDTLGFIDALTGCYRLAVYHVRLDSVIEPADYSDPVCVSNQDIWTVSQQPSTSTANGAKFVTPMAVRRLRPYEAATDKENVNILITTALVDTYQANIRSSDKRSATALSNPRGGSAAASSILTGGWLDANTCIYFGSKTATTDTTGKCGAYAQSQVSVGGTLVLESVSGSFRDMAWDSGFPDDTMRMRVYSPAVLVAPDAYSQNRSATMQGGCAGPTSGGVFGQCCSAASQCASGVCDTTNLVCTRKCTQDSDCPIQPVGSLQSLISGYGQCNSNGFCAAASGIGWAYAPYCKYCNNAKFSGKVVPNDVLGEADKKALVADGLAQVKNLVDQACESTIFKPMCTAVKQVSATAFTDFATSVSKKCTNNPVYSAVCSGGFNPDAVEEAIKNLFKQAVTAKVAIADAISTATDYLLSFPPLVQPGRSAATPKIVLQSAPALISIVTMPPTAVSVGDMFETTVKVTVASGGPVPLIKVKASITNILDGTLIQSVESFLTNVAGNAPPPSDEWTTPQLSADRIYATTDANGLARFRLRVTNALSGSYAVVFETNGIQSPKTRPIQVTNPVQEVAITQQPSAGPHQLAKFPGTVKLATVPAVKVTDFNGYAMPGKTVRAFIVKKPDITLADAAADLKTNYAALGAIDRFKAMAQLLVQGARSLQLAPPPAANAKLTPATAVTDANGVATFTGLSIEFSATGTYNLVFVVDGFASAPSSQMTVETLDTSSLEYQVAAAVLKALMFFSVAIMFLGNSTWHGPWAMIVSLVAAIVYIAVTVPLTPDSDVQRYFMIVILAGIIISFGVLLLLHFLKKNYVTFADRRKRSYMEYTQRALAGAGLHFGKGGASGTVAGQLEQKDDEPREQRLAETLAAKRAKDQIAEQRASYMWNLKEVWRSMLKMDYSSGFFFPTRITASVTIGFISMVLLFAGCVNTLIKLRQGIINADAAALRTVLKGVYALEALVSSRFSQDLFTSEVQFGYDQAYMIHAQVVQLSEAVLGGFVVGAIFSIMMYLWTVASMLLDFRVQVLAARRGQFSFDRRKLRVADASNFVGIAITNALLFVILNLVIVAFIIAVLAWHLTRDAIFSQWRWYITIIIPSVVTAILKKKITYEILTSPRPFDHIAFRRGYMLYDLIMFFILIYTSITTAIVRYVIVMVVALISMPRLERSPLPAWIERYTLMDAGSKSYHACILQHHEHNHPIARSAAWMFEEALLAIRARNNDSGTVEVPVGDKPASAGTASPASAKKSRAAARWRMAWMLYRHPELRKYRNVSSASGAKVEEEPEPVQPSCGDRVAALVQRVRPQQPAAGQTSA